MRGLTDIQRAARYFYIIRVSYGADRRTFGCSKKSLHSAIDRLPEIQDRLKDVVIENRDFAALVKTYDRENALFYFDPPYFQAEKFYDGFTPEDHERLYLCIRGLKGQFVLSYNDHPDIRTLYKDFNIHEVERSNPLAHKQGSDMPKYKELIITGH
jgi:DNA adenine methylase